jgi:hypothetical protein
MHAVVATRPTIRLERIQLRMVASSALDNHGLHSARRDSLRYPNVDGIRVWLGDLDGDRDADVCADTGAAIDPLTANRSAMAMWR